MSKRNIMAQQTMSGVIDEWLVDRDQGQDQTKAQAKAQPQTLEELMAAAAAAKAAAEKATKIAEEAAKAADEAAKAAEAEAKKAKEVAAAEKAKVIAEAKAAGKYRMAYLPVMADGTLGRPYASPFLAEQASPMGKVEKRLCWGAVTGPIGDPLTPEEMEDIQ